MDTTKWNSLCNIRSSRSSPQLWNFRIRRRRDTARLRLLCFPEKPRGHGSLRLVIRMSITWGVNVLIKGICCGGLGIGLDWTHWAFGVDWSWANGINGLCLTGCALRGWGGGGGKYNDGDDHPFYSHLTHNVLRKDKKLELTKLRVKACICNTIEQKSGLSPMQWR